MQGSTSYDSLNSWRWFLIWFHFFFYYLQITECFAHSWPYVRQPHPLSRTYHFCYIIITLILRYYNELLYLRSNIIKANLKISKFKKILHKTQIFLLHWTEISCTAVKPFSNKNSKCQHWCIKNSLSRWANVVRIKQNKRTQKQF